MLQTRKPKAGQQKPKLKKTRTFTNSQQTLCEEQRNYSLLDFSKPEQRKKNALVVRKNQSQRQLQAGGKKGPRGKSKGKAQQSAAYEFVNYKSSINSEIVFSNEETARQEEKENRITIRVKPAYLVQSRQLGATIKREYQRKVEAAVKIQKVYRGYLTRKVLQRCMEREQERLQTRLLALRPEIFANVQFCNNFYDRRPQMGGGGDGSSESDEDEHLAYRHHEPIFSQEEIRDYLSSSEEEDFDQKAFDNHIIFQTNEEYFDSHKSSLNHPPPKNKLSASHFFQQEAAKGALPNQNESLQEKMELNLSDQIEKDSTLKIHKHSMEDFEKTLPNQMESAELGETIKENYHTLKNGPAAKISELELLKCEQARRWDEMIHFLKAHVGNQDSKEEQLISSLIRLSEHNMSRIRQTQRTQKSTHASHIPSLSREKSKEKVQMLKQSRKMLEKSVEKCLEEALLGGDSMRTVKRREDDESNYQNSKLKFAQNPIELKRFFGSLQSHNLQPLVKLREEAIKANEMSEMRKLSEAIESKKITQEEFLLRLDEINRSYNKEKVQVAEEKEAIKKGYQAIIEQAKGAVFEAHLLGMPLPFSRSDEGIKYKTSIKPYLPSRAETVQTISLEADEERKERRAEAEPIRIDSSEQESSDLSFSEQQLLRFQKAKLFNLEFQRQIAGLGSNITISEQLEREKTVDPPGLESGGHKPAGRQIFLIEEFSIPQVPIEQEQAADELLNQLIWQAAGELFLRPIFTKKLIDKSLLSMPGKVRDSERLSFIEHLERHFPPIETLNGKLNQKISPLPKELLRCMRIDFSEESEAESYEEIGKYEFIIGQEVCNQAVRSFRKSLEPSLRVLPPALEKVELLCSAYAFPERLRRYLLQREKYVCDRLGQTQELRWEVMNIEIHCIFDAWNQEIISLRSERIGYSGIGLNELTLSIVDQNVRVREEQTMQVVAAGKERLLESLGQGSPGILFPRAARESEELERDSKWIFYADEALSYALELVYLIEEDIFAEIGKDLSALRSS